MVFCVLAELAFPSAAIRDANLADIVQAVGQTPHWETNVLQAQPLKQGQFGIRASLRFISQQDEEQLFAFIENVAVGARLPLPGSVMTLHNCTHDEGTNDCVVTATRTW